MTSKRAAKSSSSPFSSPPKSITKKRAAAASKKAKSTDQPKRKRGRPSNALEKAEQEAKEQKTLEETLADFGADEDQEQDGDANDDAKDAMKDEVQGEKRDEDINGKTNGKSIFGDAKTEQKNAADEVKSNKKDQNTKTKNARGNNTSIVQDDAREAAVPSSILEKGVIYFFFRGRVGVEDPQGLEDIARSFIILRPIPLSASIGDGPLQDDGSARLIVVPKKMLPKSQQDRFLAFVEKKGQTIEQLREFLSSNKYTTKASGTSNSPAAIPSAEGVYAITSTGHESHLAYHVTVPEMIGKVQQELGINEKGSFVLSVKNPKAPSPANTTLDSSAQYPEKLQKKFHGLRWMPLIPELLDYDTTQFLIIGEGIGFLGKAVQEMEKDKKDDEKEKPEEELQKLEDENHERVDRLKEDDPVFADLGLTSKEYLHLQTNW